MQHLFTSDEPQRHGDASPDSCPLKTRERKIASRLPHAELG